MPRRRSPSARSRYISMFSDTIFMTETGRARLQVAEVICYCLSLTCLFGFHSEFDESSFRDSNFSRLEYISDQPETNSIGVLTERDETRKWTYRTVRWDTREIDARLKAHRRWFVRISIATIYSERVDATFVRCLKGTTKVEDCTYRHSSRYS